MLPVCRRTVTGSGVLISLLLALTGRAFAQSEEDRAAARALAQQGVQAFSAGQYSESLDLFTRAESLLHAPPHVLYLARSAEKLGQLVRARELFLKLGREELPANAPQAFRDAQAQAREEARAIEPRLASVVITVKSANCPSPKVEMDGKPVSSAVLGVPVPADPGKHRLTATAAGCSSAPVEVSLAEGGRGRAELILNPGDAPAATPATSVTPAPEATRAPEGALAQTTLPPASPERSGGWMRPASYVAFGVGALGLGAGVYFGLASSGQRKDADAAFEACKATSGGCDAGEPEAQEVSRLDDKARSSMTLSIVGIAAGVVGIGAGTALFILSPSKESGPKSARVSPWIGVGSAGLSGTW